FLWSLEIFLLLIRLIFNIIIKFITREVKKNYER
ncbi:phosphate ABC transporter permease subunit PstC, partial [Streptococcus suis]